MFEKGPKLNSMESMLCSTAALKALRTSSNANVTFMSSYASIVSLLKNPFVMSSLGKAKLRG